jgi:hypothetical protein
MAEPFQSARQHADPDVGAAAAADIQGCRSKEADAQQLRLLLQPYPYDTRVFGAGAEQVRK